MNCYLLLALLCVCINGISAYSVRGNKIYDPTGALVTIRGVDRPGFEWSATGSSASEYDYTLMASWGSNVVRISMNQDFWLTIANYPVQIDQQIAWARETGMGVILDLHWNKGGQQTMADRDSITFWSQVAARYKNNDWVMFELYNEPHDVTWDQWLNGDANYAGMQNMYDAVRAAGSNNVVIVCGLNWAFDLSGVGAGYAVTGTNVVYATHPYDYAGKQSADWPAAFGYLASTYPVIMTEFGQYCAQNTYVLDLLAYAESNGIHWTAWAWFVSGNPGCAFPSIIVDWTGTPSPVGSIVKSYLLGLGPTGLPTTKPTSPPTAAPTGMTVFADSLTSLWQSWSWGTFSLADTSVVHSGTTSIRLELVANGGVYLHTTAPFSAGSYSQLVFWVNGGTTTKPSSAVSITLYGTGDINVGAALNFVATANTWTQVVIPLTNFGVSSSTVIVGIVFQSGVDASLGNIYLDDITFSVAASSTGTPTTAPTKAPTTAPTTAPTKAPTTAPTTPPTKAPTTAPTSAPTAAPTKAPTTAPTSAPTTAPTKAPTTAPTTAPTKAPTTAPTAAPTKAPTTPPTAAPTTAPTKAPTAAPTTAPTTAPTKAPTSAPTTAPTKAPTAAPTTAPTKAPTTPPTAAPTKAPTTAPTTAPTNAPGACDASNVYFTHSVANSWQSGDKTYVQYNLEIRNTCNGKRLTGLTFSASNFQTTNFWKFVPTGAANMFELPQYVMYSTDNPFVAGYISTDGEAVFTPVSASFQ